MSRYIIAFFCLLASVNLQGADFHKSMESLKEYRSHFVSSDAKWKYAYSQYEKYKEMPLRSLEFSKDMDNIPFILHHVWLGSSLPDYAKKFRRTWIELNKGWTFILWTDHPSYEFGDVILESFDQLKNYLSQEQRSNFIIMDMRKVQLYNQRTYSTKTKNYGEKSDLIRYEAIFQVGGLYVDTDFECLKSFESLHCNLDFFIGVAHDYNFSILNGLMAAKSNDPILAEVIKQLHTRRSHPSSLKFTGPHFLTDVIFQIMPHLPNYKGVMFPSGYFYPIPATAEDSPINWLRKETYAIHYWKCSWM